MADFELRVKCLELAVQVASGGGDVIEIAKQMEDFIFKKRADNTTTSSTP